jgi:uncharacterized protein (TIRG00374 family)
VRRRLNFLLGILISAFFVYLAFRRVQIREIYYSLKHANYLLILPNMAVVILTMVIRAERWRHLLEPLGKFHLSRLFPSVMIGFMANNILPARLGEVVRAYSLGAKSGHSRSSIFASVVLERVFDSLVLLAMFWLVIMFIPFPSTVKKFGHITLALNIILIAVLILLKRKTALLIKMALKMFFFLPSSLMSKLEHIIGRFADGLSVFKHRGILVTITSWSVVLWVLTAVSNYFVFMAFGMYPNIAASFILLLFVAAGVMLPSAPGFVGVFQAATIGAFAFMNELNLLGNQMTWLKAKTAALTAPAFAGATMGAIGPMFDSMGMFGISKAEALSFSIVLWLCQYLPVTILGLYYLRREHFSLRTVET